MFKVNDYVVYNATGVYKIVDIRKEKDISDNETEYYVLQPAFNNNLTIKTPVHSPKVMIRGVITKEEVLSLISTMPEKETIWIDNDRQRCADFKAALKSGENDEWVKLIKTIYLEKQEKSQLGKKLMKTDLEIMETAEKNLNEEFAIALNISPDEVPAFILNCISQTH